MEHPCFTREMSHKIFMKWHDLAHLARYLAQKHLDSSPPCMVSSLCMLKWTKDLPTTPGWYWELNRNQVVEAATCRFFTREDLDYVHGRNDSYSPDDFNPYQGECYYFAACSGPSKPVPDWPSHVERQEEGYL